MPISAMLPTLIKLRKKSRRARFGRSFVEPTVFAEFANAGEVQRTFGRGVGHRKSAENTVPARTIAQIFETAPNRARDDGRGTDEHSL
jgi:hypothetical protein